MEFNRCSALKSSGLAGYSMLVPNTEATIALVTWIILDIIKIDKPPVLGTITGSVARLIAVTPVVGFISLSSSIIVGTIAAVISYIAVYYIKVKL